MGLNETIKTIIDELNAPRFFEARWGCIRWGKINQKSKVVTLKEAANRYYNKLIARSVDVPAFIYADREVAQIVRKDELNEAYLRVVKQGA